MANRQIFPSKADKLSTSPKKKFASLKNLIKKVNDK
jgi:hypothetical protein